MGKYFISLHQFLLQDTTKKCLRLGTSSFKHPFQTTVTAINVLLVTVIQHYYFQVYFLIRAIFSMPIANFLDLLCLQDTQSGQMITKQGTYCHWKFSCVNCIITFASYTVLAVASVVKKIWALQVSRATVSLLSENCNKCPNWCVWTSKYS